MNILNGNSILICARDKYQVVTRIGVFAQGQILCISPNGLQAKVGKSREK